MRPLGGTLAGAPSAVSSSPDRIDVFAAGPGKTPWHWSLVNGIWIGPAPLVSANIPAEGLCAVASGADGVEVFAAGPGNTPWWWRLKNGIPWFGPMPLPGGANLSAEPLAAVASGPNSIDVFAAGAGNLAWWWRWDGARWNGPIPLPGNPNLPAERMAAISANPPRLDVFAVGASTHLWHWWTTAPPAWNVQDLGGSLPAEGVSAVSWAPGRIDVFAAARLPGRNPLQHWWSDGGAFNGPEDLGGNIVAGSVSAVSRAPNRLDVFGISGDARLARWQWDGFRWSGPTYHGENVPAGDVSAVARGHSRVDVFVGGIDNTLRQWPGAGLEYITHEPWTNLDMNWQVPSVNNDSPIAPVPPLGPLAGHCHPDSLDDLVGIVREAERVGRRVRAVGSGWSNSDVAMTGDYLVETNKLNREIAGVLNPDVLTVPQAHLLHFEAGIRVVDLVNILDSRGLAMPTLGGSSGQTLAGVLSTSTHGTEFDRGPIPEVVRAIHLVAPGGVQHWIEPTMGITKRDALRDVLGLDDANIHYDDEWFNSALVSMGCFGIIYSVIIEVVQQFDWVETVERLTYTAARARMVHGAPGNPFDVPGNEAVNLIVNPFVAADGTRPCFLVTRKAAPATGPSAGGGPPAWLIAVAAPGLIASFEANPQSMDAVVTQQTRDLYPATVPGQEKRGWAHTITTSAEPPPSPRARA
jgi:FAD/FMN-containing dehydrogenase